MMKNNSTFFLLFILILCSFHIIYAKFHSKFMCFDRNHTRVCCLQCKEITTTIITKNKKKWAVPQFHCSASQLNIDCGRMFAISPFCVFVPSINFIDRVTYTLCTFVLNMIFAVIYWQFFFFVSREKKTAFIALHQIPQSINYPLTF